MQEKIKRVLRDVILGPDDVKSNPIESFNIPYGMSGMPLPHIVDPKACLQTIEKEAWIFICLNVIGKSLSAAPIIVEEMQTVDSKPSWVKREVGPLAEMIAKPNPRESIDILEWRLIMALLAGDAYLVRSVEDNEIYFCPPNIIRPIPTAEGVEGYEVRRGPQKMLLEKEEVVHILAPSPISEFYGLSPITAIQTPILINHHYHQFLWQFFKNGAVPGGLLSTDQPLTDDTAEKARKRWNLLYQGTERSHEIAMLGNGLKYQTITPPLKDLIVDLMYKMPREVMIAAFGVPPVLVGLFEYANYANSAEQIRIFWENTIKPMQRVIAGALNIQLVPYYQEVERRRLRLRFDNSNITALQEDENARATRQVTLVSGGIKTPNEAREELGLEKLDQEGADELRLPSAFNWLDPQGSEGGGQDDAGKAETSPRSNIVVVRKAIPHLEKWEIHHKKISATEKAFARLIRKHFDAQLDRVLSRLDKISRGGDVNQALLYAYILSMKDDASDDAERLLNLTEESAALRATTDGFMRDTVHQAGQNALDQIAVDLMFSVSNPRVAAMIEQFHNRSALINDTTYERIKEILRQAYDEGLGLPEIERQLRGFYSEHSKVSATRTAQTEMNGMVNGGAHIAWNEAGVEKKEWISAMLPTSRSTHVEADGQIVSMTAKFLVGGEYLMWPSAPEGSPGNVINCHCAFQPASGD